MIVSLVFLMFNASQGQWVRSGKSRAISIATAQTVDMNGDVISSGIYTCNTTFDATALKNNSCLEDITKPLEVGKLDIFITKHDALGSLLWATKIAGSKSNAVYVNSMATDGAGNIYMVGEFQDTLFTDAITPLVNLDTVPDGFIIKVLADGMVDWGTQVGGIDSSFISVDDVIIRGTELWVTGTFRGKLQVGADKDSLEDNTMFYASYDLDGSPNWMKNFKPSTMGSGSVAKAIAGVGDSTYLLFEVKGDVELGTTMITSPPANSSVLISLNASGDINAVHQFSSKTFTDLAVTASDSTIYLTGVSTGTVKLDGSNIYSTPGTRAMLVSLNLDGEHKWSKAFTSNNNTNLNGTSLSVSSDDLILLGGTFSGTQISGGGKTDSGPGDLNGFVSLIDSSGVVSWIKSLGDTGSDAVLIVNAVDNDKLYVAGYFTDYIRLGGEEIVNEAPARNAFIGRLDICPDVEVEMLSPQSNYICEGDPLSLAVTNDPSYTYSWLLNDSPLALEVNSTIDVTETGTYFALIDDGNGCVKKSPSSFVGINPLPQVSNTTSDALVKCAGDSVKLKGPPAVGNWQWYELSGLLTGETNNQLVVKTDGRYFLRATSDSLCVAFSDTLQIQFFDYPSTALNLNGKQVICGGETVELQAEASVNFTYQWYKDGEVLDGETTSTLIKGETGIYNSVIKNIIGCRVQTMSDTIVVQNSPIININYEDIPPLVCSGDSIKIVADKIIGQTYQWYKNASPIVGANGNSLNIKTVGNYEVLISNSTCDRFSDLIVMGEDVPPLASIANGPALILCENDEVNLQANAGTGFSYKWFRNDALLSGQNESILTVGQAGNYNVEVIKPSGCHSFSSDVNVKVNPAPPSVVSFEGEPIACEGELLKMRANIGNNYSYQWFLDSSPIPTAVNRVFDATVSGAYLVEVTNSNNCTRVSAVTNVSIIPQPVSEFSFPGSPAVCEFDSLLLTASGIDYEYQWLLSGNEIAAATQEDYYAKEAGSYRLVSYVGNCRDTSDVVMISLVSAPKPKLKRNETFLSIELFPQILWHLNDEPIASGTSQIIQASEDGFYKVLVTNTNGCSAFSNTISICLPVATIERERDVLTAYPADRSYQWTYDGVPINGASLQQLTVQQSGNYTVIVTSNSGCSMESVIVQACIPFPEIEVDPISGIFTAKPTVAKSYQWYLNEEAIPGETLNVLIPTQEGSYYVEIGGFDDCVSISEPYLLEFVTGVRESIDQIKIFPNPATDVLYHNLDSPFSLKIFRTDGAVLIQKWNETSNAIDISDLANGIYFIRMQQKEKVIFKRFLKN